MNQFFNQSPYGKIPLDFDGNFSGGQGELPNHTEKRQLMLLSTVAGLCVVFFLLLQNIIPKIMVKMGIANIYIASEEASICIDIILSLICIFIPFLVASFVVKKISPQTEVLPFRKPNSPELFGIAIAIGVLAMLLSNYITSAFIFYMDNAGVEFSSPSEAQFTGGTASFLLYILRGAIVPALIEEFALRGVIMQPLRKYGDKIAIIISSLIFAVMHGNMVQAPFAFILGCAIGYLVILTESLWTGVAIHFINNAFSIIMAAISTKMGYEVYFRVFTIISLLIIVAGVAATLWFVTNRKKYPRLKSRGGETKTMRRNYNRSALKTYFLNPALLVAFGFLIYNMTDYIKLGG